METEKAGAGGGADAWISAACTTYNRSQETRQMLWPSATQRGRSPLMQH